MQFGTSQARQARYFYEKTLYTGWPFAGTGGTSSLATGTTNLASASNWNPVNAFTWAAALEMVQTTRNSDVTLTWSADGTNNASPGTTTGFPANLRQQEMALRGVSSLSLNLNNNTGASVSSWQTNYAVSMKRLTAAEKLLAQRLGLQGYALNTAEQKALQALNITAVKGGQTIITKHGQGVLQELIDKGTIPIGIDRMQAALYDNRITNAPADPWAPSTSGSSFKTYSANVNTADPTKGEFIVLTEIAFEPASAPPNATLTIARDGQSDYLQLNSAAFTQSDEAPWQVWIPAVNYLTFSVENGTGATGTNTVPMRLKVARIQMSEIIAVQFGLIDSPDQLSNPSLYAKALSGIV